MNQLTTNVKEYWNDNQLQIISNTIAPGLSAQELCLFGHICNRTKLDPFAKQIYAMKHGGRFTTIISIDGFRLIAERTGKYAPGKDTEFLYDKNEKLVGAKVFVKKLSQDGTWHEISATALLSEYSTGKANWVKMPHVMIEKCAEARALRRAFPADFSGLYGEEEMQQANVSELKEETITDDEYQKLWCYLEHSEELQFRIKNHMKQKYGHEDFTRMPKGLYPMALMRAKEEYMKNNEEEEVEYAS